MRPLFAILPRAGLALAAGAGCLLSAGCVGNPFERAQVDPNSAVAADVQRITAAPVAAPTFRGIPSKPTDLRAVGLYGQEADRLRTAGVALINATEPATWTLAGTSAFADEARRRVGPELPPAPPSNAEDFAKALRERATPPPPR